jgi:hypothetical protein
MLGGPAEEACLALELGMLAPPDTATIATAPFLPGWLSASTATGAGAVAAVTEAGDRPAADGGTYAPLP